MSMEYRLRRTLPSDRVAIIMPVDHGLIFDRIEGLETPSAPFLGEKRRHGFHDDPGPGEADRSSSPRTRTSPECSRSTRTTSFASLTAAALMT